MKRYETVRMPSSEPRSPASALPCDPYFLEVQVVTWAGEAIARAGRRLALLGRVEALRLGPDGKVIVARVRDTGPIPHRVEVRAAGDHLETRCTCAFEDAPVCKHAVAAVEALRFPANPTGAAATPGRRTRAGRPARGRGRIIYRPPGPPGFVLIGSAERALTREERVALAQEEELAQAARQARHERLLVREDHPEHGALVFYVRRGKTGREERVTVRGPGGDRACCTCDVFARDELGTCKHVERVRIWLRRRKRSVQNSLLSVWWRPRPWTDRAPDPIRELRVDPPGEDLPPGLTSYFEPEGRWLRPAPEGVAPSRWASEAVDRARRVASQHGWKEDVAPEVMARIREAAERETSTRWLFSAASDPERWERLRARLGLRLHAYQVTGAKFLVRAGRALLADDMGLGKTVQAVAAALVLREVDGARRALVVCPASIKYQWSSEILRAAGERGTVVEGRRDVRLEQYRHWSDGFLILNYELVLRDLEAIREARPDLVILDEAQRIKNWDTKTARAAKQLHSRHAFVLTGTPLENRLVELHSLVEFLHPRALGPRWRLLPFHAVTDSTGRVLAYHGLDILRARLSPFFLRRNRAEVLDQLPHRTDNTFWTGMTAVQRRPYRRLASRVAAILARQGPLSSGDVRALLQALTAMRILCNAYAQYAWERNEKTVLSTRIPTPAEIHALHSPKLEELLRVMDDLLEQSESKIVVFSQWERMLRLAHFVTRGLLKDRGEWAGVFHGGLDGRARRRLLEAFRRDPRMRVLFSTDAGGLGLNLQETASVVINLEVPWNPAVLDQRVGRVHRIGQRRSVQVLHFVTRASVEERVRKVVEGKRALFDGLLVDHADQVILAGPGRETLLEQIRGLLAPASPGKQPAADDPAAT